MNERFQNIRLFAPQKTAIVANIVEGYDLWSERYPGRGGAMLIEAEENALLPLLPDLHGSTCLDLACGTSRLAPHLGTRGAHQIVGVDLSLGMLRHTLHIPNALSLCCADALNLPFRNYSFDFCICGLALGHMRDLLQTFQEVKRILKPGSSFIFSDLHPFCAILGARPGFDIDQENFLSIEYQIYMVQDYLEASTEAGFQVEKIIEPLPTTPSSFWPIIVVAQSK